MYISMDQCFAQEWCKANNVEVPIIEKNNWVGFFPLLKRSQYRVERAFNNLLPEQQEILKALADIEPTDLTDIHQSGCKLHHFTREGQRKAAKALRTLRQISQQFPTGVAVSDFFKIDYSIIEDSNHGSH